MIECNIEHIVGLDSVTELRMPLSKVLVLLMEKEKTHMGFQVVNDTRYRTVGRKYIPATIVSVNRMRYQYNRKKGFSELVDSEFHKDDLVLADEVAIECIIHEKGQSFAILRQEDIAPCIFDESLVK